MTLSGIFYRIFGILIVCAIAGLTLASILAGIESAARFDEGRAVTLITPFSSLDSVKERDTPKDRIKEEDIQLRHNSVIINIPGASLSKLDDKSSRESLFSSHSEGLVMNVSSPSELKAGDIVSYFSPSKQMMVYGRISHIGEDKEGWYAQFSSEGRRRIRFNRIEKVVVAVLY